MNKNLLFGSFFLLLSTVQSYINSISSCKNSFKVSLLLTIEFSRVLGISWTDMLQERKFIKHFLSILIEVYFILL